MINDNLYSSLDKKRLSDNFYEAECLIGSFVLDMLGFDDFSLSELECFVDSVSNAFCDSLRAGSTVSSCLHFKDWNPAQIPGTKVNK